MISVYVICECVCVCVFVCVCVYVYIYIAISSVYWILIIRKREPSTFLVVTYVGFTFSFFFISFFLPVIRKREPSTSLVVTCLGFTFSAAHEITSLFEAFLLCARLV